MEISSNSLAVTLALLVESGKMNRGIRDGGALTPLLMGLAIVVISLLILYGVRTRHGTK